MRLLCCTLHGLHEGALNAFARFGLLLALLGAGLVPAIAANETPSIPSGARSGDLIFRKGTEAVSDLVRAFDGGEFSHVGILIAASDLPPDLQQNVSGEVARTWFVLHATPSEVEGRTDTVVLDPLAFFISPALSRGHAIYHVTAANAEQRSAAVTAALAQLGQPFSLTNPDGIYCTQLPYAAWLSAGVDLDVRFKRLAIFFFPPRDFLLPSALRASPHLQPLPEE